MRITAPASRVSAISRGVRARMFLRSFAVQGSWNFKTLIGAGFAWCLVPVLRAIHGANERALSESVARHAQLFNSHPYLALMAIGAVARMEADGESPAVIERFKAAVRGSLGTLGDRLVWAGLRPVCLLAALTLFLVGGPAWWFAAIAAFLVLYNTAHLAVRLWAFRLGLRQGKNVGEELRRHPITNFHRALSAAGAFLVGLIIPLIAGGALVSIDLPPVWIGVACGGALVGLRFGPTIRTPLVICVIAFSLLGVLLRVVQ
jgi:mannose/fructose/N-acetylgalactosamine-specific phosphotransferase system component IID